MEIEVKCPLKNNKDSQFNYNSEAFQKAFDEYKKNSKDGMFGGLEHPTQESPFVHKLSDIAVKINDINIDRKFEDSWLDAKIELLETPAGQTAQQMQISGVPMKLEPSIVSNPETGEMMIISFDFVPDWDAGLKKEILAFIQKFHNEGTIKTFTEGCCYWFAYILCERFRSYDVNTSLAYNQIKGHFAAIINGRFYDITGEIPSSYEWDTWESFKQKEPMYAQTVIRDCIKLLS